MKSGRCVFRNLYLAGHRFLCILFERVSNQLAQFLMQVLDMAVGTVLYFLVQTEFDFCFFGGEVAGSANNRHYVTYQEQFRLLHIHFLGENRSFVSQFQVLNWSHVEKLLSNPTLLRIKLCLKS